jgi:hypothetical protein
VNNQGVVIAKSNQSEAGSISKRRLFLTLDLFALQCEINKIWQRKIINAKSSFN